MAIAEPPSPKPAPPEPPAPPACQVHLEDVPFEACATGSPVLVSYDGDAPAVLPGTLSGKVDLCVAGDTTPIDSTDFTVNLEAATSVVAQLRTATVYATRRSVRVVYQVFDAAGNTRVQPPFVRLHATKEGTCGTKDGPCVQQANCDRPDATSGIGECKLEVRPDFFSSDGDTTASLHLTLNRDELPPFATVSLAKATVGGWAPADNFVVGGALPAHPVYAGAETFDMELLAKSEAPSEERWSGRPHASASPTARLAASRCWQNGGAREEAPRRPAGGRGAAHPGPPHARAPHRAHGADVQGGQRRRAQRDQGAAILQ